MTSKPNASIPQISAVAGIIATVALFRVLRAAVLPDLPNFSPVMAMAFCGGLFLPGLLAWLLPLAVIALSDVALSLSLGYPPFGAGQFAAWCSLLIGVGAGRWVARWQQLKTSALIPVIIANALIFYLVTNAVSWAFEPSYPRDFGGLLQALTTGLPGYPPTWQFFRNALISDILFVGLIFIVRHFACGPSRSPVGSEPRRLPG
jgi:Family of unknown function (DUF6580)